MALEDSVWCSLLIGSSKIFLSCIGGRRPGLRLNHVKFFGVLIARFILHFLSFISHIDLGWRVSLSPNKVISEQGAYNVFVEFLGRGEHFCLV